MRYTDCGFALETIKTGFPAFRDILSMPTLRAFVLSIVLILTAYGLVPDDAVAPHAIGVSAKRIDAFDLNDPSRSHFGELDFRGGLILKSPDPSFGGFSSLNLQPDGSLFLALSDQGNWLCGRIVYQENHPAAISDAKMAPALRADGKFSGKWDTESMARDGGILYVGIERENQIVRFDYGHKGLCAPGTPIPVPPAIKDLPFNQGLEALVFVPRKRPLGGTLIAFSEQGLNEAGDIKAFLIGGPSPGTFYVKRTDGYDISDASLLPGNDLLVLERQYSPSTGVSVRIRRIPLKQIVPGSTVDGPTLMEARKGCVIDNMEALSVYQTPAGATVLTLLSDDNFSPVQATILLQFTLAGNGASKPRASAK
jgi:hypothetical protein